MLKARNVYWFAQIGGWTLLSLLIFLSWIANDSENSSENLLASIFVFFIFGILLSHSMRYLFIRWDWLSYRLSPLIPRVLLISIVVAAIMSLINYCTGWILDPKNTTFNWLEYLLNAFTGSIFFLLWNGLYFVFHFFQKSRLQEVNNLQLTASQNEIELKNLRSQLNPHFLFNSLNSIRALIDIDPIQAKDNVTTLSNLLRKSLILGKEKLVTLRAELDLINDYLDLEKVRFEERVQIEIHHDEQLNDLMIPPFILQTLVENAFKHGISRLIEGGTITIETSRNGQEIILVVRNDGKLRTSVDTGIGIENTVRRLELQYGDRAKFSLVEIADKKVQATIQIKHPLL